MIEGLPGTDRKFLVECYRKLEVLLLIYDGVRSVSELSNRVYNRQGTLYVMLRRYRKQGLIKGVREMVDVNSALRFKLTKHGLRWLAHMLEKECALRRERGMDVGEAEDYLNSIMSKKGKIF